MRTDIIDLKNSSFECNKVGKFPKPLFFANGGWVGNKPMVCGGAGIWESIAHMDFQKNCYILQENGAWKEDEVAKLIRGKENFISGSVVIKDQLFIPEFIKSSTKGYSYLNFEMVAPSKYTRTLQDINKWGQFVDDKNTKTCIVNWDANTIMLIGADSQHTGKNKETLFINIGNKTVTPGPQLKHGRYGIACHEMSVNGESYVVVTGGGKSTEILPKSSFGNGWQRGKMLKHCLTRLFIYQYIIILAPDSPVPLYYHQMVASSDKTKLYTIGNHYYPSWINKKIFEFSCEDKSVTKCKWTEMVTKLKDDRFFHVAFPISNELTEKICK